MERKHLLSINEVNHPALIQRHNHLHLLHSGLSFYVHVFLSRSKTYFPGKDPVSYPLILLLSLLNGLAASPVLQWHTDLSGGGGGGEKNVRN